MKVAASHLWKSAGHTIIHSVSIHRAPVPSVRLGRCYLTRQRNVDDVTEALKFYYLKF